MSMPDVIDMDLTCAGCGTTLATVRGGFARAWREVAQGVRGKSMRSWCPGCGELNAFGEDAEGNFTMGRGRVTPRPGRRPKGRLGLDWRRGPLDPDDASPPSVPGHGGGGGAPG